VRARSNPAFRLGQGTELNHKLDHAKVRQQLKWPLRLIALPELEPKGEPLRKRPVLLHRPLPLLGSNQDSPDPEGPM
jgi:hypothetical protein